MRAGTPTEREGCQRIENDGEQIDGTLFEIPEKEIRADAFND